MGRGSVTSISARRAAGNIVANGCGRLQIRDNGDAARQVLFDTGANTIGEGLATLVTPGITWEVGPYRLRTMGAWMQAEDGNVTAPTLASLQRQEAGERLADRSRSVSVESEGFLDRLGEYPGFDPGGYAL